MLDWIYRIVFRLHGSLFRNRVEHDFSDEVQAHLQQLVDENIACGMSPDRARRAANLRFGGVTQIREMHRERRGIPHLHAFLQDLRLAVRLLRKDLGFTAIAVLTLAAGIGLNTTVFTIYDSIALRLLPVNDPSTVVRLMRSYEDGSREDRFEKLEFDYIRRNASAFEGVVAAAPPITVAAKPPGAGEPEAIHAQLVSGNYFPVLGIAPPIGRAFLPEEDGTPGAAPVAILSHRYWKRRFLSDPAVLGKTILINSAIFTVVGVAPQSFVGTGAPPIVPDLWIPAAMSGQVAPHQDVRFQVIGRRKPGVDTRQLAGEMTLIQNALETSGFDDAKKVRTLAAKPATFFDQTGGGFEVFIWVVEALLLAVTAVLLIGCLNLVNLLLARATSRRREIAVRCALGAGKRRIVQQLCTETALLGLLGGAAGLLLSYGICRFLSGALETKLAQFGAGADFLFVDLRPSGLVFAYAFAVSLLTGVLVGLAPARQAARTDVASAMKQDTPLLLGGRGRFRDVLIAVQVAVCLALLVGAGLLGRGVERASHADPGFDTRRLFELGLADASLGRTPAERATRTAEVAGRLRETAGVSSVALAFTPPLLGHATGNFEPLGSPVSLRSPLSHTLFNLVSPEYFQTLGIPLLTGRSFTRQEAEQDAPVIVISERTAQRFWPGEDPLGKRISVAKGYRPAKIAGRTFTVIGVAKSVRSTVLSKVDPAYVYFTASPADTTILLLRTAGSNGLAAAAVRDTLQAIDRPIAAQAILMNVEAGPMQLQRLMTEAPAYVAAVLGGLGLLLATVGIYGVVAYLVNQRTREIGVRMALGATRGDVLRLIFRQALKPVLWGVPVGLAGAATLSALLGKMVVMTEIPDLLFGVSPWSPVTFLRVLFAVVLIVWAASWIPARRAMRIEPATSLRCE
jgi:predicted permease